MRPHLIEDAFPAACVLIKEEIPRNQPILIVMIKFYSLYSWFKDKEIFLELLRQRRIGFCIIMI